MPKTNGRTTAPKLSTNMEQVLRDLAAGNSPGASLSLHGRSAHGGFQSTLSALRQRGLIQHCDAAPYTELTEAGRAVLANIEAKA